MEARGAPAPDNAPLKLPRRRGVSNFVTTSFGFSHVCGSVLPGNLDAPTTGRVIGGLVEGGATD